MAIISSFLRRSPSVSFFYFHKNLSTLTYANHNATAHSNYSNPFVELATTKFKISSSDVAKMLKKFPFLERLKTLKKVEQSVDMLKKYGFTQEQIALIIKRQPPFLQLCAEKIIEPKILLLRDLGIEGEHLANVVTRTPTILGLSLQHTLIPNAAFLQYIFKTQQLFIKAILRDPSILTYDLEKYLKPSVAFFEECGFVGEQLSNLILLQPGLLLCTCLTPAKADFLQSIGVEKGSKMYKHVLMNVAICNFETSEAKMNNLQLCGLTAEESKELCRVSQFALRFSQERVRQNMEFIVNDMQLPANSVLKWPCLLQYSLKVVKPRVLVLKKIQTLDNLGHLDMRGMTSILTMSEAKFANKIIKGHPESRLLNEIYQEALTNAKVKAKAGTKSKTTRWCFKIKNARESPRIENSKVQIK